MPELYSSPHPLHPYCDGCNPESNRVRRVSVVYDRVALAVPGWQRLNQLSPGEQEELHGAFARMIALPLPWHLDTGDNQFTETHAQIVKNVFPQYQVYFVNHEVVL
jgi:hypothetical protein